MVNGKYADQSLGDLLTNLPQEHDDQDAFDWSVALLDMTTNPALQEFDPYHCNVDKGHGQEHKDAVYVALENLASFAKKKESPIAEQAQKELGFYSAIDSEYVRDDLGVNFDTQIEWLHAYGFDETSEHRAEAFLLLMHDLNPNEADTTLYHRAALSCASDKMPDGVTFDDYMVNGTYEPSARDVHVFDKLCGVESMPDGTFCVNSQSNQRVVDYIHDIEDDNVDGVLVSVSGTEQADRLERLRKVIKDDKETAENLGLMLQIIKSAYPYLDEKLNLEARHD